MMYALSRKMMASSPTLPPVGGIVSGRWFSHHARSTRLLGVVDKKLQLESIEDRGENTRLFGSQESSTTLCRRLDIRIVHAAW